MSTIDFCYEILPFDLTEAEMERAMRHALTAEGADLDLSVVLLDNDSIHEVNQQFLNHDYPTDVITFDLRGEGPGVDAEILISTEFAKQEAELRNVSCKSEVLLYCIHGILHLLGYDDHDPDDRERMHQRQTELLAEIGYETTS